MRHELDLRSLEQAYAAGAKPSTVLLDVYDRIAEMELNPVWISLRPRDEVARRARELDDAAGAGMPLYGVPFAVKDNIDVAGMPTTAGCPAYAYAPGASASVVARLEASGAVAIGKTNLDQFATGLVGTRSPYGACASVFDDRYISGGSSSGSAVAVASGLVSFALGTDTAGSGRVPAAFNNLVGLKPTRGFVSAAGVVPACRSLDCVSIFALTASDAAAVFDAARGHDPSDPYSRRDAAAPWLGGPFRFGVLRADQREFFGDDDAAGLYDAAIGRLESLGGTSVPIDYEPFREVAALLYAGPWVAERLAAIGSFLSEHADEVHPVVRGIVAGASKYTAVDAYRAEYRLEELRQKTSAVWNDVDFLLLPTTGTIYTRAQVDADPVGLNTNLGRYTNFVNLLDLAAVAVPAGFRPNGLPFGVTLIGQAGTDRALLVAGDRLHRAIGGRVGGGSAPLSDTPAIAAPAAPPGCTLVAVVGAHLSGQPLNGQLTARGARLVETTRTAADYRFYALANTTPPKPGLVREPGFDGPGIEVEVWAIPTARFGEFVAEVVAPLGIGTVHLAGGASVKGFVCEPSGIAGASEITHLGGWRAYLAARP